jgi:D-amino peptidase
MKVYIVTDMEGVDCVVLWKQTGIEGLNEPMYQQARHLLTAEVNAAVDGAIEGGANEVLVVDGHGANSAYNLVPEELSDDAQYVLGSPWDRYLPSFDDTVDMVFMVGQHAMAGTKAGVLDHTMSSKNWVNAYINGVKVGEIGFVAYFAGDYDVPVTFLSGDLAACNEAKALMGKEIVTAAVKIGLARNSARCLTPRAAQALIRQGAKEAISKKREVKPLLSKSPVEVVVELLDSSSAKSLLSRKNCEPVNERTVKFTGENIAEVYENMFT